MAAARVTLLLAERERFAGQALPEPIEGWLSRGDTVRVEDHPLARVFDVLPRGWPVAAVTRQRDAGDAAGSGWLRADPAYVRPDINGARLLAIGESLALDASQAAELIAPLRPLFGDAGFIIDAPHPARWYVKLLPGARLPEFASPADALGADLFDCLPGAAQASPEARRWRALLSEAQIVLHNHPLNGTRAERGLAPVNSVWFWGAGLLPDRIQSDANGVFSDDDTLQAFAEAGGVPVAPLPDAWAMTAGASVYDLRRLRSHVALAADWLVPIREAMQNGHLAEVAIEFEGGPRYVLRPGQRWRLWRRTRAFFGPAVPGAGR